MLQAFCSVYNHFERWTAGYTRWRFKIIFGMETACKMCSLLCPLSTVSCLCQTTCRGGSQKKGHLANAREQKGLCVTCSPKVGSLKKGVHKNNFHQFLAFHGWQEDFFWSFCLAYVDCATACRGMQDAHPQAPISTHIHASCANTLRKKLVPLQSLQRLKRTCER